MEADEAGTLAALRDRRKGVVEPLVRENGGRIVKFMGDGVLVEFASAVNALRCALDPQKRMAEANEKLSERQIVLRIGVNLGEVVGEGSDIFGDGVNIAARLESLAEPGGICISGKVHDEIRGKLDFAAADLGDVTLKNITRPVRAFRISAGTNSKSPAEPRGPPAKASIAVLPFLNMSGDPEQEHFTDGLTEDIITDLSNVPGFFVIARNSTFAYKGKSTDVRQIAHDLGVKYILEGSARRSVQRLRINVQLIDAGEGGNHVWAERFDRDLADIFEVQDEVTRRVVEAITGKLGTTLIVERYHPTNLDAYDLCMRGRDAWRLSDELGVKATHLFEKVIELDPNYPEAYRWLALCHNFSWVLFGHPQRPARDLAMANAIKAAELDPLDSSVHSVLGVVLTYEGRWDEAAAAYREALRLNPNNADALADISDLWVMEGKGREAVESCEQAFRLNPHPAAYYFMVLGQAQIAAGDYEAAVRTLREEATYRTESRRLLAAALAMLGRMDEAQNEARLFMASNPYFSISRWSEIQPYRDLKMRDRMLHAYRLAGLPG